ncbi:MAG: deoxyguanosinetriphosphate triphosphohydrolase [Armatimonadota bacterium]|nr:deoxyguanosinetriphosphate triphosphohydrolase [Armatimonadota bacterium]MDR7437731.1 deoxyguanosinetriphosphate triphosphohydrolase [Armatimonadota bacterium]MDR7471864.1 deoxyguanosinetriphosphate triphosphohydrolase [Armatimonadota bacterium]MDR7507264.1 deoxyguanosinetriphosphate triphosphohydrolase [Armatimonadota bacterium]MDR7509885.1 deoxyguanosinetriphosphate triphosphohydrolase [Armatimonadota bacterium]
MEYLVERQAREAQEEATLAPYATRSVGAARRYHEPPDRFRTEFQRDRDRVLHSTAFRRLQHKTQVFVVTEGDFYRTRLTHTLEVSQIARSIAAALGLNVDLVEAIALAHDLGHPPFGHAGEQELHALMADHGGFEHNLQSLRVVDELEVRYAHAPGLNLTWPVRQGIATHATIYDVPVVPPEFAGRAQPSLEAQVVDLADMIAYCTHDLDDALRIGLADEDDLAAKNIELWADAVRAADGLVARAEAARTQVELTLEEPRGERAAAFLPPGSRKRADVRIREAIRWMIGRLVEDAVVTTARRIAARGVRSADQAMDHPDRLVTLSDLLHQQLLQLAAYLRDVVYLHPDKLQMEQKARRVVRRLFEAFVAQPRLLPRVTQERLQRADVYRVVCDYIAGMTDRFALDVYTRLFETSGLSFGGGPRP